MNEMLQREYYGESGLQRAFLFGPGRTRRGDAPGFQVPLAVLCITGIVLFATAVEALTFLEEVTLDNPEAHYRLDETSGTTAFDLASNNRDGTYNNVTLGVSGTLGDGNKAASLDGDSSFVQLPGTWGGAGWNALTIEAVVNVQALTGSGFQALVSPDTIGQFAHFQAHGSGNIVVYADTANIILPVAPTSVGNWQHIVLVAASETGGSANSSRLYVNGTLLGTTSATFNTTNSASNVRLGMGQAGGRHFNGFMDEVMIYKSALSPDRVTAHFDALHAVPEPATEPVPSISAKGIVALVLLMAGLTSMTLFGQQRSHHQREKSSGA